MKSLRSTALGLLVAFCLVPTVATADVDADVNALKKDVSAAISNFERADSSIGAMFKSAAGYAVLPNVVKGGFIVGWARGTGLVYSKGKLIGHVVMSQATVGAQIGGQSFAEVVFFETQDALKTFQQQQVTMSAQVDAVAAAEGVAKNAKYQQGVAIFTLPTTGLMVEATVGGQKFKFTAVQ